MKSNHLHSLRPLRSPILRNTPFPPRKLATITTTSGSRKNRIFTPIRNRDEFSTLLLLSASSRQALITLWSTSFCASCRIVAPLVHDAIEKEGVGETEGGVGFAVVEMDAPALGGLGGLGGEYFINSIPTLLSFSRQEAQLGTKVTSVEEMKDQEFLKLWIRNEARRGGDGGAGGGRGGGLFGGLFGLRGS